MASQSPLHASITALIAAAVITAALAPFSLDDGSAAGTLSTDVVIALDADTTGNAPRTVASIEQSVSTCVGQPVDIDIVVPSPGIPANRGIAAYQFSILYDPTVVWISADDSDMLLAQAAGSNVIPIADPKPDNNGVYQSWGIDFGPSGIEPAGSSETGPGVIARITLLPQSNGVSPLTLSNVLVIDDVSQRISLESVQSGTIRVGEPCSRPAPAPTPTPVSDTEPEQETSPPPAGSTPTPKPTTAALGAATPAPSPDPPSAVPTPTAATLAFSRSPADAVPTMGGAPPPASGVSTWFVLLGLIATLGGAGLLIVGSLAFRGRSRGDTSLHRD